ncbi:c-type cytochrome [Neisseria sp. HMSC078C12]|uniref:c-type cytochrome n=1 Tax=Neisseria sp. HMSC078C12 TaxID=1715075 RepID=UPI0008A9B072|nr:c-type cytochrome [Neisseria sp. HMSC078C12]OHR15614.1 cytochrome C [Neisseria sp. HMSC078C12]
MNKLLIAVMMMAGLTACSQEAKQETQETAQAVASEVKTEAASAADATASAAQEAADKVEAAASKAEEAAKPEEAAKHEEKAEAPAAEAKPAESAKVDGKAVFEANCKACHGGLIPGAPAVGKKEDWAPRIKQGKDTLHKHALEGFNSMPAKGGNSSLSDDEVKAAVDYMANESGAKF